MPRKLSRRHRHPASMLPHLESAGRPDGDYMKRDDGGGSHAHLHSMSHYRGTCSYHRKGAN